MLVGVQVPAQKQVMGHPRQPPDPAMARVKGGLDGSQCEGTPVGNFKSHLPGGLSQFRVGYNLVDQAPVERLAGADFGVAVPHLLCPLLANEIFQVPGAIASVEATHHRADLPEHGALLGNGEVTHHLEHVAPANGKAVDRRNDWFL